MSKGYDPDFLGPSVPAVPLPSFSESLEEDVLERETLSAAGEGGRRVHRHYRHHTIVISKRHRTALFAALNVDQSRLQSTDKNASWRIDEAVGKENQLDNDYYRSNSWDKGHLVPDAAMGWGDSEEDRIAAVDDTYFYTNASLQHENFNRDEWKDLEIAVRSWRDDSTGRLCEITGPIFAEGGAKTVEPEGREVATVPSGFFKVLAYVSRKGKLEVRCFVMYQDAASLKDKRRRVDQRGYQLPVSEIEQLTGLVFDPVYHEANQGVFIAAAMVDPVGKDSGNEWISILNRTNETVSLEGWKLVDQKGRELAFSLSSAGEVGSGVTVTVEAIRPIRLVNTGGSLTLFNGAGEQVDHVSYTKQQVKEGVAVDFNPMSAETKRRRIL